MIENPLDALINYQSQTTGGVAVAISLLVKSLERSGSLKDGLFLDELKKTFNHHDAEFERADYKFLAALARMLEADRDTHA